jgi:hypothetical protein
MSRRTGVPSPQLLADRQHVPVINERSRRCAEGTAEAHGRLLVDADSLLERVTLNVLHQGEVEGDERHDPARRPRLRHGVIHFPVFITHRGWRRPRVVEEHFARRLVRCAFEIVALVEAVECRLDDAGVLAGLDLLLQVIALGPTGDVNERR